MSSASKPLVSIIIPTYNRERILSGAIESALKQTYPNKQIIVVDDGSNDDTRQLVAQYSAVEYVFQQNGGQGKARNTGLSLAKGSYIASLDSDDIWQPYFLERCIEQLESQDICFVFANWMQTDNDRCYNYFHHTEALSKYKIGPAKGSWTLVENDQLRRIYLEGCPSPSSSFVIRRTSMPNNWNERMNIADDWCLLLDMILINGCRAAFTTEVLWVKRTDGKNIYHGRNYLEVIELLNIIDYGAILERHKTHLLKQEIDMLNRQVAYYIYELFFYKIFRQKHTKADKTRLSVVIRTHTFLFAKMLLKFVYRNAKNGYKKIKYRFWTKETADLVSRL